MLPLERRQNIIERIKIKKSVKIIDLSKDFGVTEETIRRDLEKLEQEGKLKRTYGGAVLSKKPKEELPLSIRLRENMEGKALIGQIIGDLIEDGDIIMIGTGTTTLQFLKNIGSQKNIKVISNSLGIVTEVIQSDEIELIGLGGKLVRETLAFVGSTTLQNIKSYHADKVILSCKGIDMEKGIMESSEIEVDIKRAMVKSGKVVILAVDHTKFNSFYMFSIFDLSVIDIVVTDIKPSKEWMAFFDKMGIECLFEL